MSFLVNLGGLVLPALRAAADLADHVAANVDVAKVEEVVTSAVLTGKPPVAILTDLVIAAPTLVKDPDYAVLLSHLAGLVNAALSIHGKATAAAS